MEHKAKIRFPVFANYIVYVVVTEDIKASSDKVYKIEPVDDEKATAAMHAAPADGTPEAYLFFHPERLHYGTIAHESWHCVRRLLMLMGAELENEVVAYHLGYLVTELHKFFDKNKLTVAIEG